MKEIYKKILEISNKSRLSVLATIIRHSGSTPRESGTKFLIMENGSSFGTIGGGFLEAEVIKNARVIFDSKRSRLMKFRLTGYDVSETDMLCGGEADIFLEPISHANVPYISFIKQIIDAQDRGSSGVLATLIEEGASALGNTSKLFIGRDGKRTGSLGKIADEIILDDCRRIMKEGHPEIITIRGSEGRKYDIFLEPLIPDNLLYVFGGGHVSTQVVPFAARVGFKVIVIDDRKEFANPENFPGAANVYELPFENVMDQLSIGESSYIVIVTRGHSHDKTVLAQSLKTDAKYIGMIGSKRKVAIIFEKLIEEGFKQDDLSRVYSPIGLSIGAKTPEEIAISIVAELIKVRAGL